jgi:hypothetical protein
MVNPTPRSTTPAQDHAVDALVGEFLAEKRRETQESLALQRRPRRRPVLTAVLLVLCGAAWVAPSLLTRPEPPLSAERQDAGARMHVFLAAQRVFAFQRANGRLPLTLGEAGVDTANVVYWRSTDSVFELWTSLNGDRVSFTSRMNPAEFLGPTFRLLGSAP